MAAVGAATLMYGAYQTVVYMDPRANAMNQLQTEEQEFVQQTEEDEDNVVKDETENVGKKIKTNPFKENVSQDIMIVDFKENTIPIRTERHLTGSPDGKWIQVRENSGNPTGLRKDGPHSPYTHNDPRAFQPHAHVPEVTNIDGTSWLSINY